MLVGLKSIDKTQKSLVKQYFARDLLFITVCVSIQSPLNQSMTIVFFFFPYQYRLLLLLIVDLVSQYYLHH